MKYHIECRDSYIELHIDADALIAANHLDELDEDQFLDDFQNAIEKNSDIDPLYDYVSDTYSNLTPVAQGSLDLDVVDKSVFQRAMDSLAALKEESILIVTEYNEYGKVIATRELSFFVILQRILTRSYKDSAWDGVVSSYISNCLETFEEHSRWHYGLQAPCGNIKENATQWPTPHINAGRCQWISNGVELQPIIWFGLDNQAPDPKWILWNHTHSSNDLWFLDSDWEVLEELIQNVNDSFLIWYTAECCCYVPNPQCILRECSVDVSNTDSVQVLADKIETFFLNQWKLQQKD